MSNLASAIAIFAAATAYWIKISILRTSFLSIKGVGSKFFTSAAILVVNGVENESRSKCVTGPAPDLPARRLSQNVDKSFPIGETAPKPVTTTLFSISDQPPLSLKLTYFL